ncbi:MAG TPA: hypothetical protein GX747_04485 [Tenericutes bacterium]|nr:hypothetical protein [Mycoplasmatota bacterium]
MTVFNKYFKIILAHKVMILLFVGILLLITTFNLSNNNNIENDFKAVKGKVAIINNDNNSKIIKNIYDYMDKYAEIINIKNEEKDILDAIFYKDANYIIIINKGYTESFLKGNPIDIEIKKSTDYISSYMDMVFNKYLKIANIYSQYGMDEESIIKSVNNTFDNSTNVILLNNEISKNLITRVFITDLQIIQF